MEETENKKTNGAFNPIESKEDFEKLIAMLHSEFQQREAKLKAEQENSKKQPVLNLDEDETNQDAIQTSSEEQSCALKNEKSEKSEIEILKAKLQEKEDECEIAKQKALTTSFLKDLNLDEDILDLVFVPKDMDATKEKIEKFKLCAEKIKKQLFGEQANSPLPTASKPEEYDAFIEGFDTGMI